MQLSFYDKRFNAFTVNDALNDILEDPGALLVSTFDPRNYSYLGLTLGDNATNLADWHISQTNEYGWHFLDGGVRIRVREGIIDAIGLPNTFLQRLSIATRNDLLRYFGEPDDTSDILFRGKVSVRAYIWHRGFVIWFSEVEDSCSHVVFYDPSKPAPIHES